LREKDPLRTEKVLGLFRSLSIRKNSHVLGGENYGSFIFQCETDLIATHLVITGLSGCRGAGVSGQTVKEETMRINLKIQVLALGMLMCAAPQSVQGRHRHFH
jgi:hypothetical protein